MEDVVSFGPGCMGDERWGTTYAILLELARGPAFKRLEEPAAHVFYFFLMHCQVCLHEIHVNPVDQYMHIVGCSGRGLTSVVGPYISTHNLSSVFHI